MPRGRAQLRLRDQRELLANNQQSATKFRDSPSAAKIRDPQPARGIRIHRPRGRYRGRGRGVSGGDQNFFEKSDDKTESIIKENISNLSNIPENKLNAHHQSKPDVIMGVLQQTETEHVPKKRKILELSDFSENNNDCLLTKPPNHSISNDTTTQLYNNCQTYNPHDPLHLNRIPNVPTNDFDNNHNSTANIIPNSSVAESGLSMVDTDKNASSLLETSNDSTDILAKACSAVGIDKNDFFEFPDETLGDNNIITLHGENGNTAQVLGQNLYHPGSNSLGPNRPNSMFQVRYETPIQNPPSAFNPPTSIHGTPNIIMNDYPNTAHLYNRNVYPTNARFSTRVPYPHPHANEQHPQMNYQLGYRPTEQPAWHDQQRLPSPRGHMQIASAHEHLKQNSIHIPKQIYPQNQQFTTQMKHNFQNDSQRAYEFAAHQQMYPQRHMPHHEIQRQHSYPPERRYNEQVRQIVPPQHPCHFDPKGGSTRNEYSSPGRHHNVHYPVPQMVPHNNAMSIAEQQPTYNNYVNNHPNTGHHTIARQPQAWHGQYRPSTSKNVPFSEHLYRFNNANIVRHMQRPPILASSNNPQNNLVRSYEKRISSPNVEMISVQPNESSHRINDPNIVHMNVPFEDKLNLPNCSKGNYQEFRFESNCQPQNKVIQSTLEGHSYDATPPHQQTRTLPPYNTTFQPNGSLSHHSKVQILSDHKNHSMQRQQFSCSPNEAQNMDRTMNKPEKACSVAAHSPPQNPNEQVLSTPDNNERYKLTNNSVIYHSNDVINQSNFHNKNKKPGLQVISSTLVWQTPKDELLAKAEEIQIDKIINPILNEGTLYEQAKRRCEEKEAMALELRKDKTAPCPTTKSDDMPMIEIQDDRAPSSGMMRRPSSEDRAPSKELLRRPSSEDRASSTRLMRRPSSEPCSSLSEKTMHSDNSRPASTPSRYSLDEDLKLTSTFLLKLNPLLSHLLKAPETASLRSLKSFNANPGFLLSQIVHVFGGVRSTRMALFDQLRENFYEVLRLCLTPADLEDFGWKNKSPDAILSELLGEPESGLRRPREFSPELEILSPPELKIEPDDQEDPLFF